MSVNSALSYGSKVASAGIGKSGSGGNAGATSTGPEEIQNSVSKLQYKLRWSRLCVPDFLVNC